MLAFFLISTVFFLLVLCIVKNTPDDDGYGDYDIQCKYGPIRPQMRCPHCDHDKCVRAQVVKSKKGISGAKATGAVITGGLSVLATGLSQKEYNTKAHCDNCGSAWTF